jgi:lysophospholipase L1-like esterase
MSAYSTAHSLVRLQFGLVEHDPDMILVMHAVNDLTVNYAAAALGQEVDPHYLVKYGARGYTGEIDAGDIVLSRVVRGIRNRLWPRREASLPPAAWAYDLERGVGFFSRNLRSIAHWAAAEGVDLGLLTMPYSRDPSHYAVLQGVREAAAPGMGVLPEQHIFSLDMDRYNQATREVAQEEGILLLDMATYLQEREGDMVDPVHYSTAGILRFGEIVARTLAPSLPVPAGDSLPGAIRECTLLAEWEAASGVPPS